MITLRLRIELIILAVVILFFIIHSVNKYRMSVRYSLVWLLMSVGLIIIALFPKLVWYASRAMNIQTPSNLIYLLGILFLLLVVFLQTCTISRQAEKIKTMMQIISIENYLAEEEKRSDEKAEKTDL